MANLSNVVNFNEELVIRNCFLNYGKNLSFIPCLRLMMAVEKAEEWGVAECGADTARSLPLYRHSIKFLTGCDYVEILYLQYLVPPLMILCFIGNMLNLLIYGLPLLRRLIKVIEVLHASSPPLDPFDWLEPFFWSTKPYLMWISNISGTMSTWLTLMVTMETVMCIMWPFVFRKYCTKRVTWIFLILSLLAATLLMSTLLMTVDVEERIHVANYTLPEPQDSTCWYLESSFRLFNRPEFDFLRRILITTTMAVSIVLPTIAMLVCTILIIKQFTFKNLGEAFSQRRKCVIRMTVATTLLHLLLEGPATISHVVSAVEKTEVSYMMCVINHSNNLLCLVNATIPFFVFLMYNEQFRHMTVMYIKALMQTDETKRKAYFSQAGMRCSRMSRIETERSMVEHSRFASRPSNV
ncbi:unnamed protein product [Caenorhabditis angaria]|uniref:G-protein coupled receptors family 1 profile domain-containing protein n=1 Tax=Caenorhabditis angaria TaxID=860376 RepID=A0A9P1IRX6_9PELO|nr:unnamed protein product [Caenorhabditis angaria]